MKNSFFFLFLIAAVCFYVHYLFENGQKSLQPINSILGDISFVSKYGFAPKANNNEDLRITEHLSYVEALLRRKDVSRLSQALQYRRLQMLDLLHTYCTNGIFPRNYDYVNKRMPCFIDKENRICAVGYLVEKTAGRHQAQKINNKYKYHKIMDMQDPFIDEWISSCGLSKKECAMIQPTYGYQPDYNNSVSTGYGVVSAVLGGANVSFMLMNKMEMTKGTGNKIIPGLGSFFGAVQCMAGAGMLVKMQSESSGTNAEKNLSYMNIGLGTTSIILSVLNLATNANKLTDHKVSLNLYRFPASHNAMVTAVGFTKRF